MLGDIEYRHILFVIQHLLRLIFLREREFLAEFGRCAWQAVRRGLATDLGQPEATPGAVTSLALAGDSSNQHPRVHVAFAGGDWDGTAPEAAFRPWPADLGAVRPTQLFRRLVLRMLVRRQRPSEATAQNLLARRYLVKLRLP